MDAESFVCMDMSDRFRIMKSINQVIAFIIICGQVCCVSAAEISPGLPRYVWPEKTVPYGTIRYEGVVNATIYLIDGKYTADDTTASKKLTRASKPVRYFLYIAIFPVYLVRGLYRLIIPDKEGIRATPGRHRVRVGYWTNTTKWVTRDFDIDVAEGNAAVIETIIVDGQQRRPDLEVARIEHQDITVYFNVKYETIKKYKK